MEITEGRLEERACPDCDGLERRAFGEAVSARGELASYAIGWTTGAGHDAGRMTIGIGAGNPGGGTFHIEVVRDGEDWGMRIADEPFEDVPEGGPDLTRAQALEHEDLRFVWHVADHVMAQDRRAWWMESWLMGTMAYVTQPVLDRTAPVRAVVHDEDGDRQLLCETVAPDEARLMHLHHALDHDPSLIEVLDLASGERADRDALGAPWRRAAATP